MLLVKTNHSRFPLDINCKSKTITLQICIILWLSLIGLNFSVSFQIHWLMSIRSPAKIFVQIIFPPILMIVGLSILRGAKNDSQSATGLVPLKLTPEMYLKPGSKESYASFALLQNSTKGAMDYVMSYLSDYGVGTVLVSSISSILSNSSHDLYNLGFNILKFPADNLSPSSVSKSILPWIKYCKSIYRLFFSEIVLFQNNGWFQSLKCTHFQNKAWCKT